MLSDEINQKNDFEYNQVRGKVQKHFMFSRNITNNKNMNGWLKHIRNLENVKTKPDTTLLAASAKMKDC